MDAQVVTVSPDGSLAGSTSRDGAHTDPGILHLAVSVQVLDPEGRWLLQRRAASKAAFAHRWANTCCTHPYPGEDPEGAVRRRLREEVGLIVDDLLPAGIFTYRARDEASGLVEHETDHVYVAVAATAGISGDPDEISDLARLPYDEALRLVASDQGAPWAGEVLRLALRALDNRSRGAA